MIPTIPNCVSSPSADFPIIDPAIKEAHPAEICCTEELKLIKLPLNLGSTLEIIKAIAGTKRPETKIMNSVVVAIARTTGTFVMCVTSRIGTIEMTAMMPNTLRLP